MSVHPIHHAPRVPLEFEDLASLPCGCVSAAYRTRPLDILVCSLEVKGPLCNLAGHVAGGLVQLGDLVEVAMMELEPA